MASNTKTQSDFANGALATIESIGAALEFVAKWVSRERRRRQTIAGLEALDQRTLSDIGLTPADIYYLADRPTRQDLVTRSTSASSSMAATAISGSFRSPDCGPTRASTESMPAPTRS